MPGFFVSFHIKCNPDALAIKKVSSYGTFIPPPAHLIVEARTLKSTDGASDRLLCAIIELEKRPRPCDFAMNEPENRVIEIYAEAMDIVDPKAREEYLSNACGADQALRKEVEDLIQ